MHSTNPISSLSRRLLLGVNACERYLIGVVAFGRNTHARIATNQPQPIDYDKKPPTGQCGFPHSTHNDKYNLCGWQTYLRNSWAGGGFLACRDAARYVSSIRCNYCKCHIKAKPMTTIPATIL